VPWGPPGGMPPRPQYQAPAPQPHFEQGPKRAIPTGPAVTVFVGNITERAPDSMVRHLLTTAGPVVSWKRVQGATGKLQAFGFCEYSNPDAGQRSIRLMNGKKIGDKALVVKVDAKTKKILDEYIIERSKKNGDAKQPEGDEIESYMDEDLKYDDKLAMDRMGQILSDHSKEMENFVPKETPGLPMPKEGPPTATLLQRMGTRDEGLDNVEEEKKGIVTREIDKFRETMKIREAEKEEQDKKRNKSKSPARKKSRSRERDRERDSESRSRDSRRRDRSRSRERESRSSARRSRSREKRRSAVSKSKSRSPPRFVREPVRSRERDTRSQKEILKEREMEEEEKEVKRAARKAEEKESIYQERLRLWEARESKKGKEYTKESQKEKKKGEETEREARKLKEFLEDYDDERDDPKFYKGRELQRRLADREREAEKDAEDRKRELDEISELKSQIFSDPKLSDPASEFQKRLQEREQQFLPDSVRVPQPSARKVAAIKKAEEVAKSTITLDASPSPSPERAPSPMEDNYEAGNDSVEQEQSPAPEPQPAAPPQQLKAKVEPPKRKKLPVADIFNNEEDDDDKPKKKLKPLPPPTKVDEKKEKSADDKRKHIKSLIEKIPTDKGALFAYTVDWDLVDNTLMEKRIRPWVHKKIAEYIGEPEPTLTDFICSKVLAGSEPRAILEDVQMVLDEEAEVFVVKMWRLLIYEIENKKQKGNAPATAAK